MAINLTDVLGNAIEDLFDDYSSTVIYKNTKKALDPLKKTYESDNPSDWDDAVASAISTLQMGISMYAISWINSTLLPALYRRASIAFTYIFAGTLARKIKNANFGGKTARKAFGVFTGLLENRQKNTEIAINMMNHQDTMTMRKMAIANQTKQSFDSSVIGANADNQIKAVELMTMKTKTGTWTKSTEDRRLYERATGHKLKAGVSWSKLSEKLNSFQEFAKNAENEVISKAQVEFDTWVANGLKKVK